jgi:hypothetical protein
MMMRFSQLVLQIQPDAGSTFCQSCNNPLAVEATCHKDCSCSTLSVMLHAAWQLHCALHMSPTDIKLGLLHLHTTEPPLPLPADDDEEDFVVVGENDGADGAAAQQNAALLASYMDTTPAVHTPESTVATLKAAVQTAMVNSPATNQYVSVASLANETATEVPGIKHGGTFDWINDDAKAAAAASINRMMVSLKKDILDGLENGTIKFYAANSTLHIPESMLVTLSAKHALHKGVLAALLTKTAFADMGLGVNVNMVTALAQVKDSAPKNSTAVAPPAAASRGAAVMSDILNSTVVAQSGKITIRKVPHHVFTSLADGSANVTAVPLSALPGGAAVNATPSTGTKRLKESLVGLRESLKRARAVAANLKPHAVALGGALPMNVNTTAGAGNERSRLLSLSINKLQHQA